MGAAGFNVRRISHGLHPVRKALIPIGAITTQNTTQGASHGSEFNIDLLD